MALDPETIQRERSAIPQFKVTGTVGKSTLTEHTQCINTYTTQVNTGIEKISFQYHAFTGGGCPMDPIVDVVEQPFAENTKVDLSLTQKEPHEMVSVNVLMVPVSKPLFSTSIVLGTSFVVIVGVTMGVMIYRKKKKPAFNKK